MGRSLLRRTVLAAVVPLVATGLIAVAAPPASAQATRTWVSGVGDDANPCSRTAPCKTWAGAISKTATGGVINALDSGGFGAVTITKSITIDGTGAAASALATGTNGIIINSTVADVVLRNIDVISTSACTPPTNASGINVVAAASVRVEGVRISGFDFGVSLGVANANPDVFVDVTLSDLDLSGQCQMGLSARPAAGKHTRVVADHVRVSNANQALVAGPGAEVWVSNSTLSLNNVGVVSTGGAPIHNMCGNVMVGNATDSAFTDVAPACAPPAPVTPPTPPVTPPAPPAPPATYCVVPKLTKLKTAKAKAALTAAGCVPGKVAKKKASKKKKGKVLAQSIPASTSVKPGTAVAFTIGK